MKESNKKFDGFAHDLIAESLKEWAQESKFVQDKLDQRLKIDTKDELDKKIAKAYFKDNKSETSSNSLNSSGGDHQVNH
jgi:hypothetical protein